MSTHLINGEFQSDKYPTTPRGKVPLSVKDKSAQDLLWQYAQRRRAVDAEFADDLEVALREAGYAPNLLAALDTTRAFIQGETDACTKSHLGGPCGACARRIEFLTGTDGVISSQVTKEQAP